MSTEDLWEHDLTHEFAGNGHAVVEDIDEDYCRVVKTCTGPSGKVTDAFLVWKPKLSLTMRRPSAEEPPAPVRLDKPRVGLEDFMKQLAEIREGFKAGTLMTKDTHIIKVPAKRKAK